MTMTSLVIVLMRTNDTDKKLCSHVLMRTNDTDRSCVVIVSMLTNDTDVKLCSQTGRTALFNIVQKESCFLLFLNL